MSKAPLVRRNEWHRLVDQVDGVPITNSVSIVVPSRNPGIGLDRLLDSIDQQERLSSCEVVVVDDNSIEPIELTPRSNLPSRVVRLDPHDVFGAGMARNEGARHAVGDVVVFLDADMLLGPLAIYHLVRWFEIVDFAAVTGVLSFVPDAVIEAAYENPSVGLNALAAQGTDDQAWRSKHFDRSFDMTSDRSDLYRTTIGACIVVSGPLSQKIGGFRELGVRGIEDIEFGHRLHNAGALMVLEREATLIHQGKRSFDSARAAEIRRIREPYMLDLLPGRRLERRAGDDASRQVPSVIVDLAGVVAESPAEQTLLATTTKDVAFIDAAKGDPRLIDRSFLETQDGAAAPYRLEVIDSESAFAPQAIEALIAAMEQRPIGALHILGDTGQLVATMRWVRAMNRAELLESADRDGYFGEAWVRLAALTAP